MRMLPLFFCLLLSAIVVNGYPPVSRSGNSAGCGQAELLLLMPCLANVESQLKVNSTLFQQFAESFSTGNLSDPVPVTDAVCHLLTTFDTCARPVAANCLFLLAAAALDVYDSALELCRSPNVYTYFTHIISCNYKMNLIPTVTNDTQFSGYIQDIAAAMANASSFSELMALPADSIMNIECRMIERVHEMFPLESVNETCGAEAYGTYGTLYPTMLELYKCGNGSLEHNETITSTTFPLNATSTETTAVPVLSVNETTTVFQGNSTGTTERPGYSGGSAYAMYSFPITLFALALLVY